MAVFPASPLRVVQKYVGCNPPNRIIYVAIICGRESNPASTPASAPGFPYLPFDPDARYGAF